jgi:hypothetical protein
VYSEKTNDSGKILSHKICLLSQKIFIEEMYGIYEKIHYILPKSIKAITFFLNNYVYMLCPEINTLGYFQKEVFNVKMRKRKKKGLRV